MIVEVETGRSVPIQIVPASSRDLRSLRGWRFSWVQESKIAEVVQLVAVESPATILGLMSIGRQAGYIEILLLESSPSNVGQGKIYTGIAGSLLAFAAKLSFELGNQGVLLLVSKTALIAHYSKTYEFLSFRGSHRMILETSASIRLIAAFGVEG